MIQEGKRRQKPEARDKKPRSGAFGTRRQKPRSGAFGTRSQMQDARDKNE